MCGGEGRSDVLEVADFSSSALDSIASALAIALSIQSLDTFDIQPTRNMVIRDKSRPEEAKDQGRVRNPVPIT